MMRHVVSWYAYLTIGLLTLQKNNPHKSKNLRRFPLSVFYQGSNTPPLCGVRKVCKYSMALADDTPSACGGVHSLPINLRRLIEVNVLRFHFFAMCSKPLTKLFPIAALR